MTALEWLSKEMYKNNGLRLDLFDEYKKACDEIDKKLFNNFVLKMKKELNQKEDGYDYVNPNHYKQSSREVIEMMELIWGKEALILHCEMTEFKYRMRAGLKPEQSIERDLEKAKWYSNKAKELRSCKAL